jgi:hypothetical protein
MFKKIVFTYSLFQMLFVSMQSLWAADVSLLDPVCYYIDNAEGKKVPVTHLDAIVTRLAGKKILHSFSNFAELESGTAEFTEFLSNYSAGFTDCQVFF